MLKILTFPYDFVGCFVAEESVVAEAVVVAVAVSMPVVAVAIETRAVKRAEPDELATI